ncbi:glycolipid transfer protein [Battus philenor]|uniref:glycolipid transfer protein n=1 Tax=Battus philenor TaxID=42288 RepID=UPI0035D0BAF0
MAADIISPNFILEEINFFPSIVNGRLNFVGFMRAISDLLVLIDRLGKVFTPVKLDMQGNIDKIKKHYKYNEDSCLFELMLEEINKGKPVAAEGVLWLNRALLFFELTFKEMLINLKSEQYDANMKKVFRSAYEGSVKKYHSWITQQLFNTMCKMSPTMPQILKSFQVDNNVKGFEARLSNFNETIHLVRCEIDNFFNNNNLFYNNEIVS